MKAKLIVLFSAVSVLTACQKNYTCTCTSTGRVVESFTIRDTRKHAVQKCSDYGAKLYQTVPFSESGCGLQ